MVAAINSNREFYPYNLDLVNKKILFYNIQAGPDDIKEFEIDMLKMQDELKKLAAFIMFTFIFMFIITDEMIEAVIPILIGLGLVPALSVVVTIVFVVFLKLWRTSPIKKLNYKKVVLFHSIYDDPDYLVSVKYLYVYEKINNRIELVSYPVGFNNFTMKDVYYGQMLYKCSIDAENESANMHYFYYLL